MKKQKRKLRMKNNTPLESWEQEQFFKWVRKNRVHIPELKLVNGSMNGIRVTPKLRSEMKKQGLEPGVPDIDIPIKRFPYGGLRIEMKRQRGGYVSYEQKLFQKLLRQQGYCVEVCKGWREAVAITKNYLAIENERVEKC